MKKIWTKEKCQEIALKYKTKKEFIKKYNSAYKAAYKYNWLDDICSHMTKNRTHWTKEKCKEKALKYKHKIDFKNNDISAYRFAYNHNFLNDICLHMEHKHKKNISKNDCILESKKYNTRNDFKKNSKKYYEYARKNKWLDDMCSHMIIFQKQKGFWNKEKCKTEALKYKNRSEFKSKSASAYIIAHKNNWINDICSHMIYRGNLVKRCLYVYEFTDNYAYIGLTYDINIRNQYHINNPKSCVFNHIKINNNYIFKQLTDYLNIEYIKNLENIKIQEYKKNGWFMLNSISGGGVGGSTIKLTFEKCKEEALKYTTKKEFMNNSHSAYLKSTRNNWLDEICSHMKNIRTTWTKEKCQDEALKYNNKTDFRKNSRIIYDYSYRKGWLNEICSHMKNKK